MTKPTKWLCAQWRLRSAWASAQSDQSLPCALNGRMPRLIWVFAGRTCYFVGFVMPWLIYPQKTSQQYTGTIIALVSCYPHTRATIVLLCRLIFLFAMWNKSFSYQDTLPLRSFLICILNFDNKTSNHIWLTIWPFVHELKKKRKKKKKLDWTTDVNSNSYRNSSIYSEAFFTQLKGRHSSMQVSEKQVAGEQGTLPLQFSSKFKGNKNLKKTALAFCI